MSLNSQIFIDDVCIVNEVDIVDNNLCEMFNDLHDEISNQHFHNHRYERSICKLYRAVNKIITGREFDLDVPRFCRR